MKCYNALSTGQRIAMYHLDVNVLSSVQNILANLTGFSLSLYGVKKEIILPPVNESRLLSFIKASSYGSVEYNDFISRNIEKARFRNDVLIAKGPAGQCYFFIPLRVGDSVFTLAGGGVYLSEEDRRNFYESGREHQGLTPAQLKSFCADIKNANYSDVQKAAFNIRSIFNLTLKCYHTSATNEKRYRLLKTSLSLVSDIALSKEPDEVFTVLTDLILFLFNAEGVSVMLKDSDMFIPVKTAGRFKDQLQSIPLRITGIVSTTVEKRTACYTEEIAGLLNLGLPEEITSVHLFPVIAENSTVGMVNIINSVITEEDAEIISEICRVSGCLFRLVELMNVYTRYLKEIDVLNTAAKRLIPVKEPDMLYDIILDSSVDLAEAEKGSLMLVDNDASCLTVKAAKGIHKRLQGGIRIREGEGVAGWVFKEGMPLIVQDIGKNEWGFPRRPKYRTGSFISIPLKIEEKTIGVLNISDKITGEVFSEEDFLLLRSFASYASIALERSNYYSLAGQMRELSITDSLTGLFNRRYFEERFFEELHRSERHGLSFSLAMLDIDDFKLFNDSEGHLAGDEVLKFIANVAKECLRVSDVIARFGGEEFTVIMPQTEKDEALLVAERIRNTIKENFPPAWRLFPRETITVSIGIATFPNDGKDRRELIRYADKALYMAKMDGKDRTVLWKN
jgi:diguanylate cyclase (GGDEF)-like protein